MRRKISFEKKRKRALDNMNNEKVIPCLLSRLYQNNFTRIIELLNLLLLTFWLLTNNDTFRQVADSLKQVEMFHNFSFRKFNSYFNSYILNRNCCGWPGCMQDS